MEIFTLLSANIRRKKGSFTSIILLMLIISMALTAFLSISKSTRASIENALKTADAPDINIYIMDDFYRPETIAKVRNHSLVDRVEEVDSIAVRYSLNGAVGHNTWILRKYDSEKYPRLKDDCSGYSDNKQKPEKGEIFVTQGILTSDEIKIGDRVKVYPTTAPYEQYATEMTVAGVVVEPSMGSAMIGWKQIFISDEDFERMFAVNTEGSNCHILRVFQLPDSALSDAKFQRQLNLDTGVIDCANGAITREQSFHYTYLYTEIIVSILMVFLIFLTVIEMIVMNHSIATSIEIDYVNLGVLKAMGFSKGRIRAVFLLQYLLAELIGAAVGFALSVPLTNAFCDVFQPIIAIPNENALAILPSAAILKGILLVSCLFILLGTRKIGQISPIRAISGGREEIYFDSRLKAPIVKKFLSASLALRQLTSNKRRYAGTVVIVALLTFFMLTITVLGDTVDSDSALEGMGMMNNEIGVLFSDSERFDIYVNGIEHIIERHTPIKNHYYYSTQYVSLNGENLYCMFYENPEILVISKGRAPLYDNEIVITPMVAEEMELRIGDKVTISKDGRTECIITGVFQCVNDTGRCFATNLDCVRKIGIKNVNYAAFHVEDKSDLKAIQSEILNVYGAYVECELNEDGNLDDTFTIAINAMKAFIYVFSVVFALVVVVMVCKKTFLQEKTDIGIYKAVGFRVRRLRLQFAVRFLLLALIGAGIGAALSLWLSGRVLTMLLWNIGVSSFHVAFTPLTIAVPVALLCVCFFLFAYLMAGRVRRVDVKELITE